MDLTSINGWIVLLNSKSTVLFCEKLFSYIRQDYSYEQIVMSCKKTKKLEIQ